MDPIISSSFAIFSLTMLFVYIIPLAKERISFLLKVWKMERRPNLMRFPPKFFSGHLYILRSGKGELNTQYFFRFFTLHSRLNASLPFRIANIWLGWKPWLFLIKAEAVEAMLKHRQSIEKEANGHFLMPWSAQAAIADTKSDLQATIEQIQSELGKPIDLRKLSIPNSLRWMIYNLGHHEDIYEKLSDEIAKTTDSEQNEYLKQVVSESLRLFPDEPTIFYRVINDIEVAGKPIPSGIGVMIHLYGLHRDPKVYGPYPDVFDPSHFEQENIAKRNPYAYICDVPESELMSLRQMLAKLVARFRWTSTTKPNELEVTIEKRIQSKCPIEVVFESRI